VAGSVTASSAGAPARSLMAALEERLLVPTYSSERGSVPILAHRGMAFPFQLVGEVRRRTVSYAGGRIVIVEAGREKLLRALGTRLFGELPRATREVRRGLWSPSAFTAQPGADIVLAGVHRWMAPRFRRAGWLIVPQSVRWQGSMDAIPPKDCSHGLLENMRKMRKQGFSIEQAGAETDWDEFYNTMVRPQALARHGPGAWVPSRQLMKEFSRRGILHLITRDGERVAGICTVPRGDILWLAISGVRQGDPALLRQGAGFAILALTIEWARAQGYRSLDAGRTGPFCNDGLQQFKRKWGLAPVADPLAHVAAVRVESPAARHAFSREPVLVEEENGLRVYAGE
jgi:hypothetical protein